MVSHMHLDKKAVDGKLTLILLRGLGHAFVEKSLDEASVLALWRDALPG